MRIIRNVIKQNRLIPLGDEESFSGDPEAEHIPWDHRCLSDGAETDVTYNTVFGFNYGPAQRNKLEMNLI